LAQVVFIHSFIHSSYTASRVYKASCSFRTRDTTVWHMYARVRARTHARMYTFLFFVLSFPFVRIVLPLFVAIVVVIVVVVVIVKVFVRIRRDERRKVNIRTAGNRKVRSFSGISVSRRRDSFLRILTSF